MIKKSLSVLLIIAILLPFVWMPSAQAASTEQTIFDFLTSTMGYNTAVACGILANIDAESDFNPHAVGDSGSAYGICQWNSRKAQLISWCNKSGYDYTTVNGQLYFLRYELLNTEKTFHNEAAKIANTDSGAYDAGYYFCTLFERPSNKESKGKYRGNLAKTTYWAKYSGNATVSYADSIVAAAESQIGSYGSDKNKFTSWFYGKTNSQPWCAIFVSC